MDTNTKMQALEDAMVISMYAVCYYDSELHKVLWYDFNSVGTDTKWVLQPVHTFDGIAAHNSTMLKSGAMVIEIAVTASSAGIIE